MVAAEDRGGAPASIGLRNLVADGGVGGTRAAEAASAGFSASARAGAARTGSQVFAAALLDHYRQTLTEMQEIGYLAYAGRQFRPLRPRGGRSALAGARTLTQRCWNDFRE